MTIIAKYAGKCIKCSGAIAPGESINWTKGGGGSSHVACPPAKTTTVAPDANAIKIRRGDRWYGAYRVGEVVRHPQHGLLTVVSESSRYYREDGLSFGVGNDSGYVFSATCRPANPDESDKFLAAEERAAREKAERAARVSRVEEIKKHIQVNGTLPDEQPEGERFLDTQTIYGGGDWFVVGNGGIWYVRNNGADGDNWDRNNVRTGGAGAIGWKIPPDEVLAAEIRSLANSGQ